MISLLNRLLLFFINYWNPSLYFYI